MCCPTVTTSTPDLNHCAPSSLSPLLQIHSRDNDHSLPLGLPTPTNTTIMHYTKPEAAAVLSEIPENTAVCNQVMRAMINCGFESTSKRSLQNIVKETDVGHSITDDA